MLTLPLIGAITLTILTTSLALLICQRHTLAETWPLLLLYLVIFYPEPNPEMWLVVGLITAVCFLQVASDKFASGKWQMAVTGLLGISFAGLYLITLAPGLLPADSGEFQLITTNLGVAHPPGFPLYTMLGHLITRLSVGDSAAWRLNLLSVVSGTAILLLIYNTVYSLTKRTLAGVTAALALGTATTFWAQATTANIRSLTAVFATLAFWALVKFYLETERQKRLRIGDWRLVLSSSEGLRDRWLVVLALALSLGITHHLSLAFMGIVFSLFVVLVDPSLLRMPRRWIRPLLAALLGLLPLLYLPLQASSGARGASESLGTLDGFLEHFLGLGFQGDFFYFVQPIVLWPRIKVMGNVMTFQFSGWLLLGMVVGLLLLAWREWKLALLMGLSFGIHTLITAMYRAPQTVEYMLPAYIPAVLCLGYGIGSLDETLRTWRNEKLRPLAQLFAATMFTATLYQGWNHFPSYRQIHLAEDARTYAQTLLQDTPQNGVILANWHWVTPLWYLQEVEGQRPDIAIRYVAPRKIPYGETWAEEIRDELANGRDTIATWYDAPAYQTLPPPEPLHEAFWFRQQPRTELPPDFVPLNETLGENIHLFGYHLNTPQTEIWQETVLTLAWQPISQSPNPLISLNAHLIHPNGRSYAQSDQTTQPQPESITLTQFRLTPRPGTQPGSYTIRIGSDETHSELGTLTVTPMSRPPVTQHPVYRTAASENRTLIGYDWDYTLPDQPRLYLHWQTEDGYVTEAVDSDQFSVFSGLWSAIGRQHYIPLANGLVWTGRPISNLQSPISPNHTYTFPQHFTANRPILRDYVASVRLVGYEEDGFHWAWCDLVDYVPAMGGIPTLKWIGGSQVTSPHLIDYAQEPSEYEAYCQSIKPAPGAPVLAVDGSAVPGQSMGGALIMYDAFTKRPLSILDERITSQFPWIPLGENSIEQ
ncbi:MAG: DUF2723 domain-containing protein [Chloroflexi bacterium]|nr:DUF2723 domain-containing protein [Chloroflexota bacterium]